MAGVTVLVTGATDGIGRHTAARLAGAGARVLLHGRSPAKVAATAEDFCCCRVPKADCFVADFASHADVRRLASEVVLRLGGRAPDVVLNNAGVCDSSGAQRPQRAADGETELTFMVNVVAPFLLTHLLLKQQQQQQQQPSVRHVVNVSSISQCAEFADFDDLQHRRQRPYSGHRQYEESKLACVMWTFLAAERLTSRLAGCRFNTLDPGTVNTRMLLEGWGPCGIDVEEADDEFLLVTDPRYAASNGRYFVGNSPCRTSAFSRNTQAQLRLWHELERIAGLTDDEKLRV